jgi:cyanate permease
MTSEGQKRSDQWLMLSLAFLIAFLLHLLLFATSPMVSLIMTEMRLSHAQFGFIFGAAMVSLILFRIPWGYLGDRQGYQNVFRVALLITAAASLLRAFSPNYLTLLASQIGIGFGSGAVLPCLPLVIKEWASRRLLGLATGIYVSGFAAGNATALGFTPYLLNFMTWREVLFFYGVLALGVCLLWWGLAKSHWKAAGRGKGESFRLVLGDRLVWLLLFYLIGAMGCYDTLATWLPKVLEMQGLHKSWASLLPCGFFAAGPLVGLLSDRFKDRMKIIVLLGLMMVGATLGISRLPFPWVLPVIFLAGFAPIGVLTICLALPAEERHLSHRVGLVVGWISALGNVGPLGMPVLFGFLIDVTHHFQAPLVSVAAVAGVVFIGGGIWGPKPRGSLVS